VAIERCVIHVVETKPRSEAVRPFEIVDERPKEITLTGTPSAIARETAYACDRMNAARFVPAAPTVRRAERNVCRTKAQLRLKRYRSATAILFLTMPSVSSLPSVNLSSVCGPILAANQADQLLRGGSNGHADIFLQAYVTRGGGHVNFASARGHCPIVGRLGPVLQSTQWYVQRDIPPLPGVKLIRSKAASALTANCTPLGPSLGAPRYTEEPRHRLSCLRCGGGS